MRESTDGGTTFTALHTYPLGGSFAFAVDFSSASPTLYEGGAGPPEGGVLKSVDGGVTWATMDDHLANTPSFGVTVDPLHPSVAYASGGYKTTNSAQTWVPCGPGGGGALAVDPIKPSMLYAAGGTDVYRSSDGCQSWSITPLHEIIITLAVDPLAPRTVYAGAGQSELAPVSKSTDGGRSWHPASTGLPAGEARILELAPSDPTTLYVVAADGVYRTVDGGASWQAAAAGLGTASIGPLAVDPTDSNIVFAGTNQGLYVTHDGSTWNSIGTGLPPSPTIASVAIDPAAPATMFASVGSSAEGWRLYRSTDAGVTWLPLVPAPPSPYMPDIAIDPAGTHLYGAGWNGILEIRLS